MNVSVLGIDLVALSASTDLAQSLRQTLIGLAAKLSPCIVAMEACVGPHRLVRIFAARGHEVRLMSPEYVRPMVRPDGACCQWRRT
jgi:transposase